MITFSKNILFLIAVTVILTTTQAFAEPVDSKTKDNNTDKNIVQMQKQLKQSDISSLKKENNTKTDTKDSLAELIAQIEALNIPDTKAPVAPQPYTQTVELPKPSPAKSGQTKTVPAKEKIVIPEPQKQQQDFIEKIDNAKNIIDPLALGDSLFACEKFDKAAKYYDLALALTNESDNSSDINRPWILFQLANCLRWSEPVRASGFYQQLVNEYPGSCWTPAASIQKQILDWQQQAQPQKILEQKQSDPNSL